MALFLDVFIGFSKERFHTTNCSQRSYSAILSSLSPVRGERGKTLAGDDSVYLN